MCTVRVCTVRVRSIGHLQVARTLPGVGGGGEPGGVGRLLGPDQVGGVLSPISPLRIRSLAPVLGEASGHLHHPVPGVHLHQAAPPGPPTLDGHGRGLHPGDHAGGGDEAHLVAVHHLQGGHHLARVRRGRRGQGAEPPPLLERELVQRGALPPAALRDGQDPGIPANGDDPHHSVVAPQVNALHALGRAAHGGNLPFVEADRPAGPGQEEKLGAAVREDHVEDPVALLHPRPDDSPGPGIRELLELRALHEPALGGKDQDLLLVREVFHRHQGHDPVLAGGSRQSVDRLAPRSPGPLGHIQHREEMDLAPGGAGQDPPPGAGREDPLEPVVLVPVHAGEPLPRSHPPAVEMHRDPLHEALMGDGDHHVLVRHSILHGSLVLLGVGEDLGAAPVSVDLHHLRQFRQHDLELGAFIGQDRAEALDLYLQFGHAGPELGALQRGEPPEAHVEDGVGLDVGEPEALLESPGSLGAVLRLPDDPDHLVDVVQGHQEPLQHMPFGLGLLQVVASPANHHLHPVVPVLLQQGLEPHLSGLPVVQRQHDGAEGLLQVGPPEEDRQSGGGVRPPLELDHEAESVPVRFIAHVGDLVDLPLPGEVHDLLDDLGLRDRVGDLGDHELLPAAPERLLHHPGPHDDPAAAGFVHVVDPLVADDEAPRGEVGAADVLHELRHGALRIRHQVPEGGGHLPEVVGRDVGAHPHRDPRRPVHQEVRYSRGEDRGLQEPAVEVGRPGHRVLFQVRQHLLGHRGEAGLGVAVGRRRVPVDGAEVPLSVHQRVPEREVLHHADQGIVDRRVPVGVKFPQHLAHHRGALLVGPVGAKPQLVHGVEDPAVNRLQAIADIGERPLHDDAHGIVEERLPHLLFDETGEDALPLLGHRHPDSCFDGKGVSAGEDGPHGAASERRIRPSGGGPARRWDGGGVGGREAPGCAGDPHGPGRVPRNGAGQRASSASSSSWARVGCPWARAWSIPVR